MDAEHARSFLQHPQVELGARLGALERAGFGVQDQRLALEVLTRDRDAAAHPPAVEAPPPRRVTPVRGPPQPPEPPRPASARPPAPPPAHPRPARRQAPPARP